RSIELNFKHLLGRAPESFDEMKLHSQILDRDGYEADIDSFIDSDEYQSVFGENTVPYYQGYSSRTGQRLLGFTNMLEMLPSLSSSDRDLTGDNQPRVAKSILYDNPAGQAKPVDVRSLIREALSTPRPAIATKSDQLLPAENQKVTSQIAEQDALIEKLRRQLSEVSPFAAVGMSIIGTYSNSGQEGNAVYGGSGNSFGVSENTSSIAQARTQDLNTILEQKTAQAKRLQDQLQDAQRMAVVGSAKANRWRRNTFSS
ncbi:MAG: phycobilisome rod-core linker polypeptide, partial [Cyanophyceae cyanobacterium]